MNKPIVSASIAVLVLAATLWSTLAKKTTGSLAASSKTMGSASEGNGTVKASPGEDRDTVLSRVHPAKVAARAPSPSGSVAAPTDRGELDRKPVLAAAEKDEDEDDRIAMADNSSRQREWRAAFASERADPGWTRRMEQELRRQAAQLLDNRKLVIQRLSCRETICRMYLKFEDQLDAAAFKAALRDPSIKYEFQSLDPDFKGEGFDRSNHTYEVMVQRPRPDGLPVRDPKTAPDEGEIVHAGEDEGIVVTANDG